MIIERPAVDWLTLTTYDLKAALEFDSLLHSVAGNGQTWEREIRGYAGTEGDGFFIGEGEQGGKKHFLINLWGDLSDKLMFHPLRPEMDCTKIDLQITLPWTDGENAFPAFYESVPILEKGEKEKGHRGRKIRPLIPPDGWCTQYVGSKSSKRFYRIYMKGEEGDLYIRFEVVYKDKKDLAGKVYSRVLDNPANMTTYLAGEVDTMPKEARIITPFYEYLKHIRGKSLPQGRTRPTPEKTLNWIIRQVLPAFKRVMGNEDTRYLATGILNMLIEYRDGLDNER